MSITIGQYRFEGPYTNTGNLQDMAGVYAILSKNGDQYSVVDIGESATVRTRIENHDRKNSWGRNSAGTLTVAVLYTPNKQQAGRMLIEQELRKKYNPPCGKA